MTDESSEGSDGYETVGEARQKEESSEGSDDEQSTESSQTRWWLTNDVLAGAIVASFVASVLLAGAGWLNLQTIPSEILLAYVAGFGSAIAWAFGTDAVRAWRGSK